ncbi:MAG TPA: protein phosphatase 2C domain-containing protein [Candidatus Sulfomarinibacteraceae bacterium]|nr:protein phosphatase 2C domain-containing protein [Candidatus Sulfomarinibacteraceae bacterium]
MRDKLEEFLFGKGRTEDHGPQAGADKEAKNQDQDRNESPLPATQPLPDPRPVNTGPQETEATPEATSPAAEPRLDVASRCHIGAVRERNEDACYTFVASSGGDDPLPQVGLFIVADGMGGHYDGHTASKTVSRMVAQYVMEKVYLPLLQQQNSGMQQPVQEVLQEAVARANAAIANDDPEKVMGTTLTAALILAGRLFLVHVGDSRAYLLEDAELTAVTRDHSLVQALQDSGQISAAEAASHPNRNLLYRALMGERLDQIDAFTRALPATGQLLLCSDGLWGPVPQQQIAAILRKKSSPQQKVDQLLEAALATGGDDNITAILVDFVV